MPGEASTGGSDRAALTPSRPSPEIRGLVARLLPRHRNPYHRNGPPRQTVAQWTAPARVLHSVRDGGVAPAACAHLLGQVIEAQWQIETFRRFEIPEVLVETHGTGPG